MYKQPSYPRRTGTHPPVEVQPTEVGSGLAPASSWPSGSKESASTPRYEGAFRAVYERLALAATHLEQSRLAARSLFDELAQQPQPRRTLLLANSDRFRSWGLVEQVLAEANRTWQSQPERALEWAQLALLIVEKLYPVHGERMVNDLAGRAWAQVAMAHLSTNNLSAARNAFEQAGTKLEAGTGDPFEEAKLLDLRVTLSIAEGKLALALEQLARIEQIANLIEEPALASRSLARQARLLRQLDQPLEAQRAVRRAAALNKGINASQPKFKILRG